MRKNIYWFYVDHIQDHIDTFISAGLTTAAIILVLRYMNVVGV